jgi:hypothetical protein
MFHCLTEIRMRKINEFDRHFYLKNLWFSRCTIRSCEISLFSLEREKLSSVDLVPKLISLVFSLLNYLS